MDPLLQLSRREDPGRAEPGTRRAARGRSRAPVARTTARACTSRSRPAGHLRPARTGHPVTMERVRMSTPPAAAVPPSGGRRPDRSGRVAGRAGRSRSARTGAGCPPPRPPAPPPPRVPRLRPSVRWPRQAGGPGADDQRVDRQNGAAHPSPCRQLRRQRARCPPRRRSPDSVVRGAGATAHSSDVRGGHDRAERVPHLASVTRSQKHTMWRYAGSAPIHGRSRRP